MGLLDLNALTVNKSGAVASIDRDTVKAALLDLVAGEIVTNGLLGSSEVRRSGGTVKKGEGKTAFLAQPGTISYVGSTDLTTGDEIQKNPVANVQISSSGTVTLGTDLAVARSGHLYLANGTLSTGDETLTLNRNVTVHHGSGGLVVGEDGELNLPDAAAPTTGYDNSVHGLTLFYKAAGLRGAGMAWPGGTEAPGLAGVSDVTIDGTVCKGDPVVTLSEGYSRFEGDLTIVRGSLDLGGQHLVALHDAKQTGEQTISIGEKGNLVDSGVGMLHVASALAAEVARDVVLEVNSKVKSSLPSIIVKKKAKVASTLTVSASGATGATVTLGSLQIEHGNVALDATVKQLNVAELVQNDGSVQVADGQTVEVGTKEDAGLLRLAGGMLDAGEGTIRVNGDYRQGNAVMLDEEGSVVPDSSSATFAMDAAGMHIVTGNFHVSEDVNKKDSLNVYDHGGTCKSGGGGTLTVGGGYYFAGTGGCRGKNDKDVTKGLTGLVVFNGEAVQSVGTDSEPAGQFGSVEIDSKAEGEVGGIVLKSHVTQNKAATLTLSRGVIVVGDAKDDDGDYVHAWSVNNEQIEEELQASNSHRSEKPATIIQGSRNSYVDGPVTRSVSAGISGSGVETGGYLFPVGVRHEVEGRSVDRFRPFSMQFDDDLSTTRRVAVRIADVDREDVEWPEEGLRVSGDGGGTILLNTVSDQFWHVSTDGLFTYDPAVRVAADGLVNVFNGRGLRLIQWDCGLKNPRLAGVYNVQQGRDGDTTGEPDFEVNDRINGVWNITQSTVGFRECNVFGIAANDLQNPINSAPVVGGLANVQYIQNVVGTAVDIYVDGNRVINDLKEQSATSYGVLGVGEHTIDVVASTAEDNSTPLESVTASFVQGEDYNVIVHGRASDVDVNVVGNVRRVAVDEEKNVDMYIVHGAAGVPAVDIRLINPLNNQEVVGLLANNIEYNEVGSYLSLAADAYNFEVTTADNSRQIAVFRVELQQYLGQAVVLNLITPDQATVNRGMMGVDAGGDTFFPDLITSTETELPEAFALQGNYPNPFNPTTNIQIDLPENAEVTVQVVDMLGRHVLTVPTQKVDAGARRAVEVNGTKLASGTYLYRVIAKMASGTHIDSGRMVLIK